MPQKVVLAVGLDSSLLASEGSVFRSPGYIVTFAGSIREAIGRLKDGDFDLVLLGQSISTDSRERLTFLIRATGSRIPVLDFMESPGDRDWFEEQPENQLISFRDGIEEIMANRARMYAPIPARARSGK